VRPCPRKPYPQERSSQTQGDLPVSGPTHDNGRYVKLKQASAAASVPLPDRPQQSAAGEPDEPVEGPGVLARGGGSRLERPERLAVDPRTFARL
jgi:hypothetical protein